MIGHTGRGGYGHLDMSFQKVPNVTVVGVAPVQSPVSGTGNVLGAGSGARLAIGGASPAAYADIAGANDGGGPVAPDGT